MIFSVQDSLLSAKVDSLQKVISDLKIQINSLDSKAILEQSHQFYSTSFSDLFNIFAFFLTIGGLVLPLFYFLYQAIVIRREKKSLYEDFKNEIVRQNDSFREELKNETSVELRRLEQHSNGMVFYLEGKFWETEKDRFQALFNFNRSGAYFARTKNKTYLPLAVKNASRIANEVKGDQSIIGRKEIKNTFMSLKKALLEVKDEFPDEFNICEQMEESLGLKPKS